MDAKTDPAGAENCGAWKGALRQIADDAAKQMGGEFDRFKNRCDSARHKAQELQHDIQAQLAPGFAKHLDVEAQKRMGEAETALAALRKDNDLINKFRERFPNMEERAEEPHEPSKAFFIGFAVILIAVESFANSRLFAEADDFGIVGGALLAVLVSCVNVLPMLLLGILATKARGNLDIPPWVWRALCFFGAAWSVFLNIGIVALRNHKIAAIGGEIDQSQSGLLFIVGMVIAGVSFWKGWGFADLYSKLRECKKRVAAGKRSYSEAILGPIDEEIQKAQTAPGRLRRELGELKNAIRQWHSDSPIIALAGMAEVRRVWQIYHDEYAPSHRAACPALPALSAENAKEWGVNIREEWDAYARQAWADANEEDGVFELLKEKIEELIHALLNLKQGLVTVINAEIAKACA